MQNQRNRTEVQSVTAAQSLAAVQTLLKAGLGCIAFMRYASLPLNDASLTALSSDLLPHDNFTESKPYQPRIRALSYHSRPLRYFG